MPHPQHAVVPTDAFLARAAREAHLYRLGDEQGGGASRAKPPRAKGHGRLFQAM